MCEDRKRIEVVAAAIIYGGKLFATQRGYGDFKDKWEFPGGKMEKGESREDALKRELKEELDIQVDVGECIGTIEYDYPKFHLTMHLMRTRIVAGEPNLIEHEAACWVDKNTIDDLDWLPADMDIIQEIKKFL